MSEFLTLTLPSSRATARALLHRELAPTTVDAVLSMLPLTKEALHARWGGNEIWFPIDIQLEVQENPTVMVAPGELLLVEHAGAWDFTVFYGKGWTFSPGGFLIGNHFATIVAEDLAAFATAANELLLRGAQPLEVDVG